jgi:hypothetical protein
MELYARLPALYVHKKMHVRLIILKNHVKGQCVRYTDCVTRNVMTGPSVQSMATGSKAAGACSWPLLFI